MLGFEYRYGNIFVFVLVFVFKGDFYNWGFFINRFVLLIFLVSFEKRFDKRFWLIVEWGDGRGRNIMVEIVNNLSFKRKIKIITSFFI